MWNNVRRCTLGKYIFNTDFEVSNSVYFKNSGRHVSLRYGEIELHCFELGERDFLEYYELMSPNMHFCIKVCDGNLHLVDYNLDFVEDLGQVNERQNDIILLTDRNILKMLKAITNFNE